MTAKTYAEMASIVSACATAVGGPFAYYQFAEDPDGANAPSLPFVVYYYPASDDVMADNRNYVKVRELIIELYTENKDFDAEGALEAVLASNDIPYRKAEAFVESERMYQITYDTEVLING